MIIDTPKPTDLEAILGLVALAQDRTVEQVNRQIYTAVCSKDEPLGPQLGTYVNGRVARDGNRVVGFVYQSFPLPFVQHMLPVMAPTGNAPDMLACITELNVLAVLSGYQRRGIASQLVTDALSRSKQAGIRVAMVTAPTAGAARFWEAVGFTIGRAALRVPWGKITFPPGLHAQGVYPLADGWKVSRAGSVITVGDSGDAGTE